MLVISRFSPATLATLIGLLLPLLGRAEVVQLCNVKIESKERIDFSGVEENWLCGDKDSAAWQRVPIPQKRLFLTGFLQARGFHKPKFEVKDGMLFVDAGPQLHVERFTVKGASADFDPSKRRLLKGKVFNASALDDATAWTRRQLQYVGYPCPDVTPLALVDEQEILLTVKPGEKKDFSIVEATEGNDLHPGVIDRYTAFTPDQTFDIRLLELTSTRILNDDLYLSSYYDVLCSAGEQPRIVRRFVPAKPRLITVGVGFDSNAGPLGRARFKWSRIDTPANSLETVLFASFREQTLSNSFYYHISPNVAPNLQLEPNLTVSHFEEANYESLKTSAGGNVRYLWEFPTYQLVASLGPSFSYQKTFRGEGPSNYQALRFLGRLTAQSHLFEYYSSDPRSGWNAALETTSQFGGLFANQTINRVQLKHQALWNLGRFDPPFAILGWRGLIGTYFYNSALQGNLDAPIAERFSLGGDEDIRGFDRKRLPGDKQGYLTTIYQGFELRAGTWFPIDIQPFLFLDMAKVGSSSASLNNTFFYAPGLGLRYASPFGSLRATLGRGYALNKPDTDPDPGYQFFFTFGKEF